MELRGTLQLMCLHWTALPLLQSRVGREVDCAAHLLSCSSGHLLLCLQGCMAGHCTHQTQAWI